MQAKGGGGLLARWFAPDLVADAVWQIPAEWLRARGVRGIVLDLDNTIIAWGGSCVEEQAARWIADRRAEGFALYIVSNGLQARVRSIASQIGAPYCAHACKPLARGFRAALRALSLEAPQVAVVGDQLFTDVAGGKRLGCHTVLVRPLGAREFPTTKLSRALERFVLRRALSEEASRGGEEN